MKAEKVETVHGRYDRPIPIADGVFWVGYHDPHSHLHSNPYLVVEDQKAILIDGGSRPDFAVVMMKILMAGIDPKQIQVLIYQHYDPDLCGSLPNLLELCTNPELMVLSEGSNNTFLSYYIHRDHHFRLKTLKGRRHELRIGERVLKFIPTPYCHSAGSFVTYDTKTKTLFSSDLFGAFGRETWDLQLHLEEACHGCEDYRHCSRGKAFCPVEDVLNFHRRVMPCGKALAFAMGRIETLDIERIAPQHGSVLEGKKEIAFLVHALKTLEGVGIDGLIS